MRRKLEDSGATLADAATDLAAFMRAERDKYRHIVQWAHITE